MFQVFWGVDSSTSSTTTIHILWFAILRFVSIQWPHEFKRCIAKYTKVNLNLWD